MRERPLSYVPRPVLALLLLALLAQLLWHYSQAKPSAKAQDLPPVPSYINMRLSSLGEPVPMAKLSMLKLQAYDYQPGISIAFRDLDYHKVSGWLGRIVDLDPKGQYPLLAAARLYSEVPDPKRQRIMTEFVYRRFLDDPDARWESLAHCAILAKHRLHDLALAQRYAKAIRERSSAKVPSWARQMEIFLLEDMNELESAKVVLGGILANREVTDPRELHFLQQRLQALEAKLQNKSSP